MKYLKFSLFIFLFSVVFGCIFTKANTNIEGDYLSFSLTRNKSSWTGYYNKHNLIVQSYSNNSTITTVTVPCLDCEIMTKPYTISGNPRHAIITVQGETDYFYQDSVDLDSYRLEVARSDFTIWTTNHYGYWFFN